MQQTSFATTVATSKHPVLQVGVASGASLSALFLIWLLLANRVPTLDRFSFARNLVAAALGGILLLIPVCRFLKSPSRIFLSGLITWTMLTLTYSTMTATFTELDQLLGTFHLFVLGTVAYGLLSTVVWVIHVSLNLRQAPAVASRRGSEPR